jgi:acetyltransferase-like isoleucine patch superfamily enzyme
MARALRLAWAIATFLIVEWVVWSAAALPVVLLWMFALQWTATTAWLRITILALMIFPSYILFALMFMLLSAVAMRVTGWRTPPDAAMRIRDLEWNLLTWVRYLAATHLVRVLSGTILRATPIWTVYLRLNGARAARRVYVNSLAVIDHNLLEFGEGTVVGADVHLSGHTVEHGVVFTGRVRTGRDVTLGTGSVIGIDVDVGDGAQVGALSLVPKHSRLAAHTVYFGIPVHPSVVNAER